MKREKVILLQELIVTQMNYWVLFTVVLTVFGFIDDGMPDMARWMLLSLYPLGLFLVRYYCRSFWGFALLHIFSTGLLFCVPSQSLLVRALFDIAAFGFMLYSLYARLRTKDDNREDGAIIPPAAGGIVLGMLLLQHYQGNRELDSYYIVCMLVYLCLFLVNYYISRFRNFLRVNESSTGYIPGREMFGTGFRLTTIYSITCGIILLLCADTPLTHNLARGIKLLLLAILRFLFSFIKGGGSEELPIEEQAVQAEMLPFIEEETSAPGILMALEKLLFMAFYVILAVCIIAGCIKLVKLIRQLFRQRWGREVEKAAETCDIREKCDVTAHKNKKEHTLSLMSPAARIRRIYKKKVEEGCVTITGGKDIKSLQPYTPRECCVRLSAPELAQLYEKARYSDSECTQTDVREARKWR